MSELAQLIGMSLLSDEEQEPETLELNPTGEEEVAEDDDIEDEDGDIDEAGDDDLEDDDEDEGAGEEV